VQPILDCAAQYFVALHQMCDYIGASKRLWIFRLDDGHGPVANKARIGWAQIRAMPDHRPQKDKPND
jgi:hypothetical protein